MLDAIFSGSSFFPRFQYPLFVSIKNSTCNDFLQYLLWKKKIKTHFVDKYYYNALQSSK